MVVFTPDGSAVITGGIDGAVRIRPLQGGEERILLEHEGAVRSIQTAIVGDRPILLTGSDDGMILLWDLTSLAPLHRLELSATLVVQAIALAITSDRRVLAAGAAKDEIRLWELPLDGPAIARAPLPFTGWIYGLAFGADGARLAAGGMRTVTVFEIAASSAARELAGPVAHTDGVAGLAFTAAGLVSADAPGTVLVWHDQTGAQTGTLGARAPTVRGVARSPGGDTIALSLRSGHVMVWRPGSGEPARAVPIATGELGGIALHPSRPRAAVISRSDDDGALVHFIDVASGRVLSEVEVGAAAYAIAYSPNGERLAIGGRGEWLQIRGPDGAVVHELASAGQRGAVQGLQFAGDHHLLVADDDGRVQAWDLRTQVPTQSYEFPGKGWVLPIAVSRDGARFAAGNQLGLIGVWELGSGRRLSMLSGHGAAVRALAFSADGARLASVSTDATLRVWNLADGTSAAPLVLDTEGRFVELLADERIMVVDEAGSITVRDLAGAGGRWRLFAAPGQGSLVIDPSGAVDGDDLGKRSLIWRTASGVLPGEARWAGAHQPGLLKKLPR